MDWASTTTHCARSHELLRMVSNLQDCLSSAEQQLIRPLLVPHAHPILYLAIDDGDFVCPLWLPMRNPMQSLVARRPVGRLYLLVLVVGDVVSRPLQELLVYGRWKRIGRTARLGRLVRRKLEADQSSPGSKELLHACGPLRTYRGVQSAQELSARLASHSRHC